MDSKTSKFMCHITRLHNKLISSDLLLTRTMLVMHKLLLSKLSSTSRKRKDARENKLRKSKEMRLSRPNVNAWRLLTRRFASVRLTSNVSIKKSKKRKDVHKSSDVKNKLLTRAGRKSNALKKRSKDASESGRHRSKKWSTSEMKNSANLMILRMQGVKLTKIGLQPSNARTQRR